MYMRWLSPVTCVKEKSVRALSKCSRHDSKGFDAWRPSSRFFHGISVKPAPGLAAQPSGADHFFEQGAGPVLGVVEPLVEDLHDIQANVQANKIGQLQRPHG